MPAGLASLCDQTVGAPGNGGTCLRRSADHHEDEDPGVPKVLDESPLFAERERDDVHLGLDAYRDVVATDEGHQQVYRDGATARPFAHHIDRRSQGGFNRSSQHRLGEASVGVRRRLPQGCAIRGFCVVGC